MQYAWTCLIQHGKTKKTQTASKSPPQFTQDQAAAERDKNKSSMTQLTRV